MRIPDQYSMRAPLNVESWRRGGCGVSVETTPTAHPNGLARFRERQAAEKRLRMAELAVYREDATEEVVEGKVYRLVRIPDRYEFGRSVPLQEAPP